MRNDGLRRYLYEYVFHDTVTAARRSTGMTIPISAARSVRARIDELVNLDDERLAVTPFLTAMDQAMGEAVPGYLSRFADGSAQDPTYRQIQDRFVAMVRGRGSDPAALPLSPYDPRWAVRSSVRAAGTRLSWVLDTDLEQFAGGSPARLASPEAGAAVVHRAISDNRVVESGPASSLEDAAGLSELQTRMSAAEYQQVRQWVLDGARDPRTGRIDANRFMSETALARSVAILDDLAERGVGYQVQRDRHPGQIKAVLRGTRTEIRLTDSRSAEQYAGARVYDDGVEYRYSVQGVNARTAVIVPTPAQAVDLVRFAQGEVVTRHDLEDAVAGDSRHFHTERPRVASGTGAGASRVAVPDAFHTGSRGKSSGRTLMAAVDTYTAPGSGRTGRLAILADASHHSLPRRFGETEMATEFLSQAITSARQHYASELDVERIIEAYQARAYAANIGEDPDGIEPPEFSGDTAIAAVQRSYWAVLTGAQTALLHPGVTREMLQARLEELGSDAGPEDLGNLVYPGDPVDQVRDHASEVVEEVIGTLEPTARRDDDGELVEQRFDPVQVARYMTSSKGPWANLEDLASACRRTGITGDQLRGQGFSHDRFADRLIGFDTETSIAIADHDSPLVRRVGQVIERTIARNAAVATDIRIDENGVVQWHAERVLRDGSRVPVTGEIGQVLVPGEHGEILTRFASGTNSLIVPGYRARIAAQRPGEHLSVEERTILSGYEQVLTETVAHQVGQDLLSGRSEVGEPASLNSVYSRLYDTTHPADYLEAHTGPDGTLDEWAATILDTESRRVRYDTAIEAGSTIYAEYAARTGHGSDPADDIAFDAWKLTGGRNMAVLTGPDQDGNRPPAGYLDPVMTVNNVHQGIVRYLVAGADVDPEGHIIPGDPDTPEGTHAPLRLRPELAQSDFDSFDRQLMTTSNLLASSEVTDPVGTAMMTFGGWGADDGIVISRDFAENHQIIGVGGRRRSLVVGDKLSDLHGNKGVVSLVVDRDMDPATARAQDLEQEVAWFRANPGLDVVMSPFSLISRHNAGTARELMATVEAGRGELQGALEAARDEIETHRSDPDAGVQFAADKGLELDRLAEAVELDSRLVHPADRDQASQQYLDPVPDIVDLQASDLNATPQASVTDHAVGQMRFIVTHMAVDEKTQIYDEEALAAGKGRRASSQLAWALESAGCDKVMEEFYGSNSSAEADLREYLLAVGLDMDADGTVRLAGSTLASGYDVGDPRPPRRLIEPPELVHAANGSLRMPLIRAEAAVELSRAGGDLRLPFPLRLPSGEQTVPVTGDQAGDTPSWRLPVLSSHLRTGQEFDDGTVTTHDYTSRYLDIIEQAARYRDVCDALAGGDLPAARVTALQDQLSVHEAAAQRSYDAITTDLSQRIFSGRRNFIKTELMANRLPDSATAVWTADPRLDIDQISVGPAMAATLNLEDGDRALVWRDPILRDAGVRSMRVHVDERLTGVAINPVSDRSFDGDFDGDSVAIVTLHTQAAIDQSIERLGIDANLVDTGVPGPAQAPDNHPLATQVSLDTQVALSQNEELAAQMDDVRTRANRIAGRQGQEMDPLDRQDTQLDLVTELSDLYRQAQRGEFGSALCFGSAAEHVASVRQVCVETGAKGSQSKLAAYAGKLGLADDGITDLGRSGFTPDDQEQAMYATAVKSHGTGLGGSYSQRAVRALRNVDLKPVLELTYPVTQSILQSKHDAAEARTKYEVLQGPGRDLWRGRLLAHEGAPGAGHWSAVTIDGKPVQATAGQWCEQVSTFYAAADGFNVAVNPDYVRRVAQGLADPVTGLMGNLEEDESLAGSLMDQLAYGGDLTDLVEAAQDNRNLFDGRGNELFACATTRRNRDRAAAEIEALEAGQQYTGPLAGITTALMAPDVIAPGVKGSQERGATRRSPFARTATLPPAMSTRTVDVTDPDEGEDEQHDDARTDDNEMEI